MESISASRSQKEDRKQLQELACQISQVLEEYERTNGCQVSLEVGTGAARANHLQQEEAMMSVGEGEEGNRSARKRSKRSRVAFTMEPITAASSASAGALFTVTDAAPTAPFAADAAGPAQHTTANNAPVITDINAACRHKISTPLADVRSTVTLAAHPTDADAVTMTTDAVAVGRHGNTQATNNKGGNEHELKTASTSSPLKFIISNIRSTLSLPETTAPGCSTGPQGGAVDKTQHSRSSNDVREYQRDATAPDISQAVSKNRRGQKFSSYATETPGGEVGHQVSPLGMSRGPLAAKSRSSTGTFAGSTVPDTESMVREEEDSSALVGAGSEVLVTEKGVETEAAPQDLAVREKQTSSAPSGSGKRKIRRQQKKNASRRNPYARKPPYKRSGVHNVWARPASTGTLTYNDFALHMSTRRRSKKGNGCVMCITEGRRTPSGRKVETSFNCDTCNVPLCFEKCFEEYHSKNFDEIKSTIDMQLRGIPSRDLDRI